ncbi:MULTISPECIES: hypothetical protein [unclassified Streptomyces]|uniref:hypothetical protein n=1 Tax=unclassified Streptomyces TaxID=2593676 RepID=UPI000BF5CAFA|nr:hypothetical protein [Streptomyces sp. Ru87]PGH48875.1 hypothetical protein CRI70_20760 [Streptomyces sp. Ru87]
MANDADLIVNINLLVDSETLLKGLQKEFKNLGSRSEDMHSHWGHSEITDAMDEFVDNWDDYRSKMLDSIESVGKLIGGTIDSFTGLDAKLAKELRKDKKK